MARFYDPTDPDQVSELQADADRRRQQQDADWRWLLEAAQGQRVVVELLQIAGLVQSSFSESALLMAKAEGARSVALYVHARITQTAEGRHQPAILAALVTPPNAARSVRSSRPRTRTDGDWPDSA